MMSEIAKHQEENTMAFFKELQLLRQLEEEIPQTEDDNGYEDSPEMRAMLEDTVRAFEQAAPKAGEIRLLSQPEKITYAAILPWDDQCSLVIPFSHFRNPATDLELAAEEGDKNGLFMQVFQCWNARTVDNTILAESWIAGHITETDKDRLRQMMLYSLLGDDLPPEIRARTGAPVFRDEDPRNDYMQREYENFAL